MRLFRQSSASLPPPDSGKPVAEAMREAAEAAATEPNAEHLHMVARYGRAKYLGEKARGHQDAGAHFDCTPCSRVSARD